MKNQLLKFFAGLMLTGCLLSACGGNNNRNPADSETNNTVESPDRQDTRDSMTNDSLVTDTASYR